MKKPEKTRLGITLTKFYIDGMDILIQKGVFHERQGAIRDALRTLFQKYGLEPFIIPENEPGTTTP